jgi:hypothetical protein
MMPTPDQRNDEKEVWNEQPLSSSPTAKRFSSTDQRSMAGTAPTDFQFTKTRDAGPVHCSDWLSRPPAAAIYEARCAPNRTKNQPRADREPDVSTLSLLDLRDQGFVQVVMMRSFEPLGCVERRET